MKSRIFFSPRCSVSGIVFVCFGYLLGCGTNIATSPTATADRTGDKRLKNVQLWDLQGRSISIRPQNHAATVFLFARTDCPISNRYAPTIRQMHDKFSSRDVAFYLVYVDPKQSPDEIVRHREAYQYSSPAVRDVDHHFVQQVSARVTPEAVVVDPQGNVVYRGRIDDRFVDFGKTRQSPTREDLSLALDAVLAGRTVEVPTTKAIGCFIDDLKQ